MDLAKIYLCKSQPNKKERRRSMSLSELNLQDVEIDFERFKLSECGCYTKSHNLLEIKTKCYRDCFHYNLNYEMANDKRKAKKVHIDQMVPSKDPPPQHKNLINEKSSNETPVDFSSFSNLNFYKQCNLVSNWFQNMNEENKNSLLTMLLDYCGPSQNHLFSLKIVQPHSDCLPNCCDMIGYLPKIVSNQIFSNLNPVSLARASQVNKAWNEIASDQLLWKRFCHMSNWRFSAESESKQLQKYLLNDEKIDWKSIFCERYKVKRNWLTGKSFIKTFYGHEEAVSCVQFDETRIVAGSAAGIIKVWNISESISSSSTMTQSALMPYLNLFGHSGTIRCLHLDGQLNRLFSGSADHTIKAWDLSNYGLDWSRVTCKMTFLGHTDTVRCLQVDGIILISGSYDNTLKIWDLKTGECTNTLRGHTDSVLCLQFDNEKIISGSADRTIRLWNLKTGNCIKQLEGHTGSITCLHFDSHRIISGSLDFDIKFWNINTGQCVNTLDWITKEGHTGAIRCLKADNQKIISCSDDKTIKIWNIDTGERYVTLKNHSDGVTCLQFNDYYILSGSYDRTIKLWDFSAF